MSNPKFHCKSEAQKRAIKASYARLSGNDVSVVIKTHVDRNGGHPHVILDDIDDCHVSVGLSTHPKKGKNSPNYRLEKDPLNSDRISYMRRQGTVAPMIEYKNKRFGSLTKNDFLRAQEYGDKAKSKYLKRKNEQKK